MKKNYDKYKNRVQIVIGLMGPKGCGKDTIANYAKDKLNASDKIVTASFLKATCAKVFGLELDWFYDKKERDFLRPVTFTAPLIKRFLFEMRAAVSEKILNLKDFNPYTIAIQNHVGRVFKTPRQMLQYIGTDFVHPICRPFHCMVVYESFKDKPGVFLITDLRFKMETDYAAQCFKFFYPVRIVGRNEVKNGQEEHKSESEWKSIQPFATIDNSTKLDDFYKNSIKVFDEIKKDVEEKLSVMSESQINEIFNASPNGKADDQNDEKVLKVGRFKFAHPSVANQHIVRDME